MSSYLVLARKYRPRTFAEVVGQEAVTRVLRGAIEEKRIAHAYLFAGPRGTGKTTLARIVARCLNCEQGPTATPCGTCERCRDADAGREPDVIEIDGASNRGIEDVRVLRDEVAYAPMRARYKVYIVDEVHMLTKPAFNALLKTLEEPPAHVVFLFATTEPHQVPDTILSRCQVLRLAPLAEAEIAGRLDEVFRREGVEAGAGVTAELARMARGGMRDALSIADKLLALSGERPTLEDLAHLAGETGRRMAERLLDLAEAGDRARLLETLAGIRGDEAELLVECLNLLRASVVAAHCGAEAPFLTGSEEERASAAARGKRLGAERIETWMRELLRARERLRALPGQEALLLELALLDLSRPETTAPIAELLERLESLERRLAGGAPSDPRPAAGSAAEIRAPASAPVAAAPAARPAAGTPAPPRAARSEPEAPAERARPEPGPGSLWSPFLSELARSHQTLAIILERRGGAAALVQESAGALAIRLRDPDAEERKILADRRNQVAAARALSRTAGRELELRFLGLEGSPAGAATQAPASGAGKKDGFTEDAADLFGGVIEEVS